MKTVLGLDLGVASIGWAIVQENNEDQDLIASGVRIIPIDTETSSNFSKGASTSKNQDRRLKRSARRNNHRYKLRKHFLIEFLKGHQLWPLPESLFKLSAAELYCLRHNALNQKISLQELARIWFHLNQKRGYIDSRKGASEEDTDTKYVEKIRDSSKNIYSNHKTVGSYFYHKLLENPIYRIKSGDDKENIFLIEDYKIEFDLIWNKQKEYYEDFLTDLNYNEVRNRIIYYKRKLKSQKHLIGECRFEKHHKCMPISSPIAYELRLWQDVNKLRITSKYGEVFELTNEQKVDLFDFLMSAEKITEKDLLKRYQFPSTKGEFKINFEKQIKGNPYRTKLIQAFKEANTDHSSFLNFDAVDKKFQNHPFFTLWHLLYATEELNDLKNTLKKKYDFNDDLINALAKISIKNDFVALSSRAARKLLPFLREGKIYSEACKLAGYNHSDSITTEENEKREIISISELSHIKPNDLRNPTVEKILNQLINLLKGLSSEGHTFDEIRIELARDLKKNAKERQNISKRNTENERENIFIKDLLRNEYSFKSVSRRDIDKYKLWKEFDGRSPYEPNTGITLGDLFNKAMYEIEHIIPKSRYFDDSLNNRTIARVHINKEKDNLTAFDYMSSKSEDILHQYSECIKHAKISELKKKYLKLSGSEIPDDFINRQLNETRYITKETLKILKKVCKNVYSSSGTVTDYLKHHWGYDNVLMELNFDRVSPEEIVTKEINGKNKKVITNWSKRLDHRHHALDAIVIACTKQGYIQQLNTLNSHFDLPKDLKPIAIKTKVPFAYEKVKNSISNILVSFKPGKKVATLKKVKLDKWGRKPGNFGQEMLVPRGSLHEESVYGTNKKYSTPIDIKKLATTQLCAVDWQKEVIEKHIEKYDNNLALALKNLKKDPILYDDTKVLDKVTVFQKLHVKRYNLQYTQQNKFDLKSAERIVNENVKRIVISRLKEFDNDPAKAFKNLNPNEGNPLYFNKDKGILIKSVRCYTHDEDYIPNYPALHETVGGKTLNSKQGKAALNKTPVDHVKGGNNHHIAIYENEEGQRIEECISFFEAFERKRSGLPIIDRNHPKKYKFITSIQQNEMFVFGINKEELESAINQKSFHIISKHLYKTQDIAPKQYRFLHHLDTKLGDNAYKTYLRSRERFLQKSSSSFNGIKVRVTNTNKISVLND